MNRESLNILLKKAYYQQLSEEERKTLKLWLGDSVSCYWQAIYCLS